MVERGLGEVWDRNQRGFACAGLAFGGINGKEDGLEAGEGRGGIGVDAGEVETREEGQEGEDDEAEVGIGGEESVVEPVAEWVRAGAGKRVGEGGGQGGVDGRGGEEGEGGAVGVGEGGER